MNFTGFLRFFVNFTSIGKGKGKKSKGKKTKQWTQKKKKKSKKRYESADSESEYIDSSDDNRLGRRAVGLVEVVHQLCSTLTN